MIVELIITATGAGVIGIPAYFMRGSRRLQKELDDAKRTLKGMDEIMLKERDIWYKMGRQHALDQVERVRTEEGISYREAVHKIEKCCAQCGRKCLHCAKEDKG